MHGRQSSVGDAALHLQQTGMGPAPAQLLSWYGLAQTVDLLAMLLQRGLRPSAACAWLDSSPPISVSVWIRCGSSHRGTSMEGTAVVALDNGREKGLAVQEGES